MLTISDPEMFLSSTRHVRVLERSLCEINEGQTKTEAQLQVQTREEQGVVIFTFFAT